MFKLEKRAVDFLARHMLVIGVIIATVLSLVLRYTLRGFVMYDMQGFLTPWYESIRQQGIMGFLQSGQSDYPVPYLLLLGLSTLLPFKPIVNIKLVSIAFDYVLAVAVVLLVLRLLPKAAVGRKKRMAAAWIMMLFCPVVVFNSAVWGQCDGIYTTFLIFCLYFLVRGKYTLAFAMFALALAFKLQAVFFLPVLVILYFTKRKFTILQFFQAPALLWLVGLLAMGDGGVFHGFLVYLRQTGSYQILSYNYPNIYTLFNTAAFEDFMLPGVVTALMVLLCALVFAVVLKWRPQGDGLVLLAVWSVLSCTMFLPGMHDRYGYAAEVLVWVYFLAVPGLRRLLMASAVSFVSLQIYLKAFFEIGLFTQAQVALGNMLVWALVTVALGRRMLRESAAEKQPCAKEHKP